MRTAVCLFVRNEQRDISEWIAFHSIIGFDAFIIYENDSSDDTNVIIDRLRRIYNIKLIRWPSASKYSQLEAYDDCLKNFREDYDWIAFIDSDKFIVPIRHRRIDRFIKSLPNAHSIVLNCALFGSLEYDDFPNDLVIKSFTKRAFNEEGVNRHTKMLVCPRYARRVHDPHYIEVEGPALHADGSIFNRKQIGVSETIAGFDICRVNHYFVKSKAHWALKISRGYREGVRSSSSFATHDKNDVVDIKAVFYAAQVSAQLQVVAQMTLRQNNEDKTASQLICDKNSLEWEAINNKLDDIMFYSLE